MLSDVLRALVKFGDPLIDLPNVVQTFFFCVIYGRLVRLDKNVLLAFGLASEGDSVLVGFQNFRIRAD